MKESRWRIASRQVIAKVVADNPGVSEKVLRLALRDAYPFGERKYTPYKLWLEEVNNYFNTPLPRVPAKTVKREPSPGQMGLFV